VFRYDPQSSEYLRVDSLPALVPASALAGLGRIHLMPPEPVMKVVITKRALSTQPLAADQQGKSETHDKDTGWSLYVGDEDQDYLDDPGNSTVNRPGISGCVRPARLLLNEDGDIWTVVTPRGADLQR
jgi:hypothetical protein